MDTPSEPIGPRQSCVRDEASRVVLSTTLLRYTDQEYDETIDDEGRCFLHNSRTVQAQVERIEQHVDPLGATPAAQLFAFDPAAFGGDGSVAIVVGDADTADDVAFTVPGMGARLTSLDVLVRDTLHLYDRVRLTTNGRRSCAVLSWMCYDAPTDELLGDLRHVISQTTARSAAARLAHEVADLRTSREVPPHLTVVAHSYGSTAAALAATAEGMTVDDLVLLGCPGAGSATHASELGTEAGHVWVGSASQDQAAAYADNGVFGAGTFGLGLGHDPADEGFGAVRFRAEAVDRGAEPNFCDHNRYYAPQSESLANIARIVSGDYAHVTTAEPRHDPWDGVPVDPEARRTPSSA